MSILAALAATAALALIAGRRTIRALRAKITNLYRRVDAVYGQLHVARYIAGHDRLTGLPNRSSATALFVRELHASPTIVALVDLDRFKAINDSHGHDVGDDLLRTVAERLAATAKAHGGMAARLAGDEFLLLLPANSDDHAGPVAETLNLLAEPATLRTSDGEVTVHPTASAGIVDAGVNHLIFAITDAALVKALMGRDLDNVASVDEQLRLIHDEVMPAFPRTADNPL